MSDKIIFMIEGGKALGLIKRHIAEVQRVGAEVRALARELGVDSIFTSRETGVLRSVQFKGKVHPEFKKETKHGSFPKKGSEWAKRLAAQEGYEPASGLIADELGVPLVISYSKTSDNYGSRVIGFPFRECGFLYLSEDGPYAMWMPDVPAEVAHSEAEGYTVAEPAKSFRLEFDGCRRIEREEWEILVAQDSLAKKRAAAQESK